MEQQNSEVINPPLINSSKKTIAIYALIAVVLIVVGMATGYIFATGTNMRSNQKAVTVTSSQSSAGVSEGQVVDPKVEGSLVKGMTWSCEDSQELLNDDQENICFEIFASETKGTKMQIDRVATRADESGATEGDTQWLGKSFKLLSGGTTESGLFIYQVNETGSAYVVYSGNSELPECSYVDETGWKDVFAKCTDTGENDVVRAVK